ncbi:hypothetical protein BJ741DRAFT_602837 [Chytriomyces cf. hyalinus JEL632]|nr:hypothetical protein BJ741DRAFT_602837 [Chytriomyces cf. hyalinus JEL632]
MEAAPQLQGCFRWKQFWTAARPVARGIGVTPGTCVSTCTDARSAFALVRVKEPSASCYCLDSLASLPSANDGFCTGFCSDGSTCGGPDMHFSAYIPSAIALTVSSVLPSTSPLSRKSVHTKTNSPTFLSSSPMAGLSATPGDSFNSTRPDQLPSTATAAQPGTGPVLLIACVGLSMLIGTAAVLGAFYYRRRHIKGGEDEMQDRLVTTGRQSRTAFDDFLQRQFPRIGDNF